MLIAVGGAAGGLQDWSIGPGTHPHPRTIAGPSGLQRSSIATDRQRVVIANGNKLVVYDLRTKRTTTLLDPAGTGVDVAIGRDGTNYVANLAGGGGGNIAVYPPNAAPSVVHCGLLENPDYVAVNAAGDVFVNQNGSFTGVIEIPAGRGGPDGSRCRKLHLHPGVSGYAGGVAIDPHTGDLLVLDDPDQCAGGIEGRLTTYRQPYGRATGHSIVIGQNCSGTVRLDATASVVFVGDESVDGSYSFILARRYPSGAPFGAFGGGNPGGFAPMPSTLPS